MGRLDGKVVVVTGASRGIGAEIARLFAAEGGRVICAARTLREGDHQLAGSLETTVASIRAAGGEAQAFTVNIAEPAECERLIGSARDTYGPVDVLVNNAALTYYLPVKDYPLNRWMRSWAVNFHAPFILSQLVLEEMISRKSGSIVNISSVLGQVGLPGYSAYAASKSGVMGFTRALAAEWARYGIQVNALAPGWFVTEMNADAFGDPQTRDRLLRDVPARRTGRLDEIGPLVVYLASAASDFMTGQTLFLDGGQSAV